MLHLAAKNTQGDIFRILLEFHPELAGRSDKHHGRTVLHYAAFQGYVYGVRLLLALRPDIVEAESCVSEILWTTLTQSHRHASAAAVHYRAVHGG